MTNKLFDGRPLAVFSVKTIEGFQARNIQCPHCRKTYASITDFGNVKILESGPSANLAMGQGAHSRYTIEFQCQCKAVITVMAPLHSQEEFAEVISEIQQRQRA